MNSLGPLVASSFGNSFSLILPCQLTINDDINQLLSPILFYPEIGFHAYREAFFCSKEIGKS